MKNLSHVAIRVAAMLLVPFSLHAEDASLYQRIGGESVLNRVVEQTLHQVAHDPTVNHSFDQVDLGKLGKKLFTHLCALTGGDCVYTGDDMRTVHAGLDITERGMFAMVEALRDSLAANGVGEREKNELLRLLAPMKRDVVSR